MRSEICREVCAVALVLVCAQINADAREALPARSEIEASEIQATWETVAKENTKLRAGLGEAEAALTQLQKNLSIANSETEVFKRQAQEAKHRIEALGLDGTGGNTARLEQRLLKAVNDLKILEEERKALQQALVRLSEAGTHFQSVATTSDADAENALSVELRNSAKALGLMPPETKTASAAPATLSDGMIISIREDLALVVANLGSRHGVKIGMPFEVRRDQQSVGTIRIVDVRDRIAGAVFEEGRSSTAKPNVGDRLRVVAQP